MIYLLQYDRAQGATVEFRVFDDSERGRAAEERLALELSLQAQNLEHEVVLLEAESLEALRLTHGRFFDERPGMSRLMATPTHGSSLVASDEDVA